MIRFIPLFALGLATAAAAQDKPVGMDFAAFSQAAMARMMKGDANSDGKLSKDEFTAAAKARGGTRDGSRMFDRMDANHDGVLDAAEIKVLLAHRFARIDADHDGILTTDERQAMRAGATDPGQ
ncbi:EF-hand domain-containing protein [Sphingomonas sp. MMS24-J13]|uniref:EF-hand domain-containing protein n=1 Tax=Sphingomonas sp. MMS24-J13 TaxID=3238686 RepID=UPI00384E6C09